MSARLAAKACIACIDCHSFHAISPEHIGLMSIGKYIESSTSPEPWNDKVDQIHLVMC